MKKIFKKIVYGIGSATLLFPALVRAQVGWSPDNFGTEVTGLPGGYVSEIVSNIAFWLLGIFGFIGVIGFIISGILYLTAAGDAEREKTAKKAMTMSIIGIIVGLAGLVVIYAANALLTGKDSAF